MTLLELKSYVTAVVVMHEAVSSPSITKGSTLLKWLLALQNMSSVIPILLNIHLLSNKP